MAAINLPSSHWLTHPAIGPPCIAGYWRVVRADNADDAIDWDFCQPPPPPKRSGTIKVRLRKRDAHPAADPGSVPAP